MQTLDSGEECLYGSIRVLMSIVILDGGGENRTAVSGACSYRPVA